MAIDVTAYAETGASWEELERRFVPALDAIDVRWLEAPPTGHLPAASLDVGAADLISLTLREDLLVLHARTSPWGPGFHQRVLAVVDALQAELSGGWAQVRDGVDHHARRDPDALRQAFLRWAHGLWSLEPCSLDGARVCLGWGEGPALVPPGHVATPLGFRDMAWVERTVEALADALNGAPLGPSAREAFLWWEPEPDAHDWAQLGRALCTNDVIWRPLPTGDTPQQDDARHRAVTCFENALRLDPRAALPWPELQRLYELLERQDEARYLTAQRAGQPPGDPFWGGYRERWIRQRIGSHWSVLLPGWLRASLGVGGHDVYFDDELTCHLSVLRASQVRKPFEVRAEAAHHLQTLAATSRGAAQLVEFDAEPGQTQGYAVVVESPRPDRDSLIQGQVSHHGERVGYTVVTRTPAAREHALRIGRSLRPLARSKVLG